MTVGSFVSEMGAEWLTNYYRLLLAVCSGPGSPSRLVEYAEFPKPLSAYYCQPVEDTRLRCTVAFCMLFLLSS